METRTPPRLTTRSSLASALPVALRLVRIHLTHFLQQIARVRLRNVRRFGPAAIALFGPPRYGRHRFFRPFWHAKRLPFLGQNANWHRLASVRRRWHDCPMILLRRPLQILFLRPFLALQFS